jgi:predicted metal-dependent hydrolase
MKIKLLVLIIIVISIIFSTAIALANLVSDNTDSDIQILQGENEVLIPEKISPFYVEDFVKEYPEILTVTYFEFEEEIGYANVFGGVGENFIIYPNKTYKITVEKNVEVKLR